MNTIKFECPHCRKVIEGDESLYGQTSRCPECQGELQVPQRPADQGPKLARLITEAGPAGAANNPDIEEETTIFEMSPTVRAYLGPMVLGLVIGVAGIGLGVFGWLQHLPWLAILGMVLLVAGSLIDLVAWLKTKSAVYRLTSQRLLVSQGLVAKRLDELELYRVNDVTVSQGFWERMLGYGTVTIMTVDTTNPQIRLIGLPNPMELKETIRIQYRAARRREGMHPTEFIKSP